MSLEWADLIDEDVSPEDFSRYLLPWAPVVGGTIGLASSSCQWIPKSGRTYAHNQFLDTIYKSSLLGDAK